MSRTRTTNRRRGGRLERLGTALRRLMPGGGPAVAAVGDVPVVVAAVEAVPVDAKPARGNRKRESALVLILLWLLPVAAAVAAFSTPFLGARAFEYLMSTGHFMVREVLVDGARHLTEGEVLALAGIEAGTHVLATDLSAMGRRLEAHPWVARARVERELPDKLVLHLHEHRAVAYVALDEVMLVDNGGEPFARAETGELYDLPIITGVSFPTDDADPSLAVPAAAHRSVARADVRAAVNLSRLYAGMGLGNRWPLGELRVEPGRRMTLVLSETGTEAVLGTGPYRQKLFRLEWILEKLHQDGKTADYVLLDGAGPTLDGRDDGRVVVRADMARSQEQVAAEASRRADEAESARALEGVLPGAAEDEGGPAHVSAGLKPAVGPVFLDEQERAAAGGDLPGLPAGLDVDPEEGE